MGRHAGARSACAPVRALGPHQQFAFSPFIALVEGCLTGRRVCSALYLDQGGGALPRLFEKPESRICPISAPPQFVSCKSDPDEVPIALQFETCHDGCKHANFFMMYMSDVVMLVIGIWTGSCLERSPACTSRPPRYMIFEAGSFIHVCVQTKRCAGKVHGGKKVL